MLARRLVVCDPEFGAAVVPGTSHDPWSLERGELMYGYRGARGIWMDGDGDSGVAALLKSCSATRFDPLAISFISSAPASLVTSMKSRAGKLSYEQDAATNHKQRTFFASPLAM